MSETEMGHDVASPAAPARAATTRALRAWAWIESWLVRIGDRLNPILVKETRQAIKSRQFTMTFVLVLAAAWVVTLGGVALIGPTIFYSASGPTMFWAYYWILSFPLAVIVPYSAYRSLASEREDNTYELLSVSTLTPRQIIAGKLGSALVQMIVYLSAVAPCLAFTYLLRGIDVLTIALLITYTALASLGLCVVGLLLATSAKQRYGQVVLSVAFVVGLVIAFFSSVGIANEFIQDSNRMLDNWEFWMANLAMLTIYMTTFALVFLGAAAQITFASDNRSTPMRIAMIVQQTCFIGWVGYGVVAAIREAQLGGGVPGIGEIAVMASVFAGCYWFIMGTMMAAEWPGLSRRVQRSLPKSGLGRMFFTWFNPGPSSGFVFSIANLGSIVVLALLAIWLLPAWFRISPGTIVTPSAAVLFLITGFAYVVLYLGVGKLVIDLLRRVANVPIAGAILIQAFLLAAGCSVPAMVYLMSPNMRNTGYSLMHASNPFWTLLEIANGRAMAETQVLVFLIPAMAFGVFLLNLKSIIREVRRQRVAPPTRVAEDELALHPVEEPGPQSPWDMPDRAPAVPDA